MNHDLSWAENQALYEKLAKPKQMSIFKMACITFSVFVFFASICGAVEV